MDIRLAWNEFYRPMWYMISPKTFITLFPIRNQ